MRRWSGWLLGVLAWPVAAYGQWETIIESATQTTAIESASLDRAANRVSFRLRQIPRDGQLDPGSQRPVREILLKRMVDCRKRQVATVSRAVFSDHDALIHHEAARPSRADWHIMSHDDPLFRRVCEAL